MLKGTCLVNPHGPRPHADVTILGADKGTAIKSAAQQLEVQTEDTYAFGDSINHLCMLQAAGHGIAMGNGVPELKEQAEYVTTKIDEDGVKNGLEYYHLI